MKKKEIQSTSYQDNLWGVNGESLFRSTNREGMSRELIPDHPLPVDTLSRLVPVQPGARFVAGELHHTAFVGTTTPSLSGREHRLP